MSGPILIKPTAVAVEFKALAWLNAEAKWWHLEVPSLGGGGQGREAVRGHLVPVGPRIQEQARHLQVTGLVIIGMIIVIIILV